MGHTFGILVREEVPHSQLDRQGAVVLAGDQFYPFPLVFQFFNDKMGYFRSGMGDLQKVTEVSQEGNIHLVGGCGSQIGGDRIFIHNEETIAGRGKLFKGGMAGYRNLGVIQNVC
jgi:hypothetical protein